MNHQLNPIYQPQGVSVVGLMEFNPETWKITPRAYGEPPKAQLNCDPSVRSRTVQNNTKDKYLGVLTNKWQSAKQIAKKLEVSAGAAGTTMKKPYIASECEIRLQKIEGGYQYEWRLK